MADDFIPVSRTAEPDFIPAAKPQKYFEPPAGAPSLANAPGNPRSQPMTTVRTLTGTPYNPGHLERDIVDLEGGFGQQLANVSTPVIGHRVLQRVGALSPKTRLYPEEGDLRDTARDATLMIGAGAPEGLEAEAAEGAVAGAHPQPRIASPSRAATAAAEEEPSTMLGRAGEVAKRRASKIPGVQAVKDADYIIRGDKEAPAPKSKVAKPKGQTNGIPWGQRFPPVPKTNGIPWGQPFPEPGAPLPERPDPALLQARGLGEGARPQEPAAALGKIPVEPQFPGAPLPEHPGEFPGASQPEKPDPALVKAGALGEGAPEPPEEQGAALGRIARPHGEILRDRLGDAEPSSPLDRLRDQELPPANPDYTPARPSIERILPPEEGGGVIAKPAPEPAGPAAPGETVPSISQTPPASVTPDQLEKQISDALGGQPLQPRVSLRDQIRPISKSQAPAPKMAPLGNLSEQIAESAPKPQTPITAPKQDLGAKIQTAGVELPEGFTPIEGSSVLSGYKYNPETREFETVTHRGDHYVHGDVSPEEASNFEQSDSKGTAWNQLKKGPGVTLVKKGPIGKPEPVKPGNLEIAPGRSIAKSQAGLVPDIPIGEGDLSPAFQRMLDRALANPKEGGTISQRIGAPTNEERLGPEEGPLAEPALSQPVRAGTNPAPGTETTVRVPGEARAYRATYQVRELADVQPSHSGQTFQANPKYSLVNDRDYSNPVNQGKIIENSGGRFDPAYHITDNPDATNGPVVIDSEGHALGGNGRTMILQRVYGSNQAGAAAYKSMLQAKAQNFGIDPAAVARMKQPVLVREIADSEFDTAGQKQDAITDFNKKGTAEMTPAERALADARRISTDTLDQIGGALEEAGPDSSLAEVLRGRTGTDILDRLVKDGALTPQDRAAFAGEAGLTPAGKTRIQNLVVGRFFEDPAAMDDAPPSLKTKLEKLAAPVARVEGNAGWDLTPTVREAVKLLEEARTHGSTIDDLLRQSGLFGESKYSPEAVAMAQQLKDATASNLVKSARQYAADAADARRPMLLGEPVSPEQAFREAFGKR